MRQRFAFTLAANGRWPGTDGGHNLPEFNWVKVDNKGTGSVDVSLNANPTAGDKVDTMLTVPAGVCRVFNVAGPRPAGAEDVSGSGSWPQELFLVSAAGTTVYVEIADHPIVDLADYLTAGPATTVTVGSQPIATRFQDGTGATLGTVQAANPGDGLALPTNIPTASFGWLYNQSNSNWDRAHSMNGGVMIPGGGIAAGIALVMQPSNFSIQSTPAVGTAASAVQALLSGGRNICTNVAFGFSATTALGGITTVTVNLRDGATGAGTVIKSWQYTLPAAVIAPFHVEWAGLCEAGSASTAMTLEFAAGVANLLTYANLGGVRTF